MYKKRHVRCQRETSQTSTSAKTILPSSSPHGAGVCRSTGVLLSTPHLQPSQRMVLVPSSHQHMEHTSVVTKAPHPRAFVQHGTAQVTPQLGILWQKKNTQPWTHPQDPVEILLVHSQKMAVVFSQDNGGSSWSIVHQCQFAKVISFMQSAHHSLGRAKPSDEDGHWNSTVTCSSTTPFP